MVYIVEEVAHLVGIVAVVGTAAADLVDSAVVDQVGIVEMVDIQVVAERLEVDNSEPDIVPDELTFSLV